MKILFLVMSLAASILWQWEPDFDKAKKTARENHELILLNFSGSDWCGPCILFRKEYLESEAFSAYAKDNLVLVNADFPRKKKNEPAPEVVKSNEALAEIYNKEGAFPLTLLLNADGKILKSWHGKPEAVLDDWITEIKTIHANQH